MVEDLAMADSDPIVALADYCASQMSFLNPLSSKRRVKTELSAKGRSEHAHSDARMHRISSSEG
jgi:hypothetical protein